MSAWTYCLQDGKAAPKIVPPRLRNPYWKGLGADSEEKHEPATDIDIERMDSLKALDPKWPIREADMREQLNHITGRGAKPPAGSRNTICAMQRRR